MTLRPDFCVSCEGQHDEMKHERTPPRSPRNEAAERLMDAVEPNDISINGRASRRANLRSLLDAALAEERRQERMTVIEQIRERLLIIFDRYGISREDIVALDDLEK